jgi:hypothetical protein
MEMLFPNDKQEMLIARLGNVIIEQLPNTYSL